MFENVDRRSFVKGAMALGGAVLLPNSKAQGASEAVPSGKNISWSEYWHPESSKNLSEVTHKLAWRALSGEHTKNTENATFALNPQDVNGLSGNMKYAHAAMKVAKNAPIRVIPFERISGSATLREAMQHRIPLTGDWSTSHVTVGFDRALKYGYKGLREKIEERLSRGDLDADQKDQLLSMKKCIDAAGVWHQRYMDEIKRLASESEGLEKQRYLEVYENLKNVPENPPTNFHEAVQSLWFVYAFQRLMGNWLGIGRIDQMLGGYLKRDLARGAITIDEARDIMANFWIKGAEWAGHAPFGGSGDAQFYQNIILGGIDADGKEVTNEVTYLILDVVEELHISDFPIAVRINRNTPQRLLKRIAEVQRYGGGMVALYNEEVVIDGLVKFGYPLADARSFTNDGCWEVIIPGKTSFNYSPFDGLTLLHETLALHDHNLPVPEYSDFGSLYDAYISRLRTCIDEHHKMADGAWLDPHNGRPLTSLFVDDCIERGRCYLNRGSKYNVVALHMGGIANVANSLLVLKKLAYEEKYVTLGEFVKILRDDWKGNEHLRRLIHNRFEFYGNDNDEADAMIKKVFDDYTSIVAEVKERNGVLRPAALSTFGREIYWVNAGQRKASPDGYHVGDILATNCSPSPGTDQKGPTAVLKSYCKMDFTKVPCGATLELKVHPNTVKGNRGVKAMVSLMKGFVSMGGWFMHVDVVDSAMLIDAQKHPDKYPNLAVRVAGWSARFATMDKTWQDMIIQRTQQYVKG